jgi:3-deoxy-D-manno-octulosonic-acid transferase
MGAPPDRVRVLGNLKYDAPEEVMAPESLAESLGSVIGDGSRPLWVAGSTVEGEEEIVLRAYGQVRDRVPQVRLLIAPRHPERFGAVPEIVEAAGLRCLRRTSLRPGGWPDGHVVVLDTLGELARVYPLATVVFVGGSLVPRGGHNILEAAVAGKPVVVGPHMENFQEIADEFVGAGAVVQVPSGDALAAEVSVLLTDAGRRAALGEKARLLVHRNRGALRTTVDALAALVA